MTAHAPLTLVAPLFAPSIGGVQTHVAELAQHLAGRRDVTVLTTGTREHAAEHGNTQTVATPTGATFTVRRFTAPRLSAELPPVQLIRAVAAAGRAGHIVHAHNYHSPLLPAAALAAGRGTFIATPHYHGVGRTDLRTAAHRLYKPLGKFALTRAAGVIAVSSQEAALLEEHFAVQATVIPNGVRTPDPATVGYPLARPTLFTCGRLEEYKRVDHLIRAIAKAGTHDLVIAGEGPASPALRDLAERLNVTDRVTFLGRVSDQELSRWLSSDVTFASCSTIEAFGLTLADALAAGLPAIASDLPAHLDVAGPSSAASFVPCPAHAPGPLDGADMRTHTALVAALAGPRPARAARPAHLMSWEQVADAADELYNRATGQPAVRAAPVRELAVAR